VAVVPNCERSTVPPEKITDYLLSETHPIGAPKAHFFRLFGFRKEAPDDLVGALLAHVRQNLIAASKRLLTERNIGWTVRFRPPMAAIRS
jgi:hypothetical protein